MIDSFLARAPPSKISQIFKLQDFVFQYVRKYVFVCKVLVEPI